MMQPEAVAKRSPTIIVGVDVQVSRGCPDYAIDAAGGYITSGWLAKLETPSDLRAQIDRLSNGSPDAIAIGIDAPRMPLDARRSWSWSGKKECGRSRRMQRAWADTVKS